MSSTPITLDDLSDVFKFSESTSLASLEDSDDSIPIVPTSYESVDSVSDESSIADVEFQADTEKYLKDHLADEKFKMCKWVLDMKRKMNIMAELYKLQDQAGLKYIADMKKRNAANFQFVLRNLCSILLRLRRRNFNNQTSFMTLFDLNGLFTNSSSSIFLEQPILEKLFQILDEWINGYSFQSNIFPQITEFLKIYYDSSCMDIKAIYKSWKTSMHYSRQRDFDLRVDRNYMDCVYFSILKKSLDNVLIMNMNYLPSLIELGQRQLDSLLNLLEKFSIPFSGPYKKMQADGLLKLQIFISSCSVVDSISNCGLPLYGIFEFSLSCLQMRHDDAVKFTHTLETMPFWLNHMPPLFNKSLSCLQNELKKL